VADKEANVRGVVDSVSGSGVYGGDGDASPIQRSRCWFLEGRVVEKSLQETRELMLGEIMIEAARRVKIGNSPFLALARARNRVANNRCYFAAEIIV
jgi:hypothetical protein